MRQPLSNGSKTPRCVVWFFTPSRTTTLFGDQVASTAYDYRCVQSGDTTRNLRRLVERAGPPAGEIQAWVPRRSVQPTWTCSAGHSGAAVAAQWAAARPEMVSRLVVYGGWALGNSIGDDDSKRHMLGLLGTRWGLVVRPAHGSLRPRWGCRYAPHPRALSARSFFSPEGGRSAETCV